MNKIVGGVLACLMACMIGLPGALRAQEADGQSAAQRLTAPGLALPATFTGRIPMASGPAVAWHLDLWPDQVFHLRRGFGGQGGPTDEIGRWSADPARNAIVLRGGRDAPVYLEIGGNGNLRLMTPEGAPIESPLPYDLTSGPLDQTEVALPMSGLFRYLADAASFTECLTGRTYPVAMEEAYIDAERAYLARDGLSVGEPVLAIIAGQIALRPAMEGPDRMHVVIDRFDGFDAERPCPGAGVPLINTFWRILSVSGEPLLPVEDAREPYLLLLGGQTPSFSATAGCNMMRGGYRLVGSTLTFGAAATTMMACPPSLDARERALAEALARVETASVAGNEIVLQDAKGTVLITAEAAYRP